MTARTSSQNVAISDMRFGVGRYHVWSGICGPEILADSREHADQYAVCLLSKSGFILDLDAHRFLAEPETVVAGNWPDICEALVKEERHCLAVAFSKDLVSKQLNALIGIPLVKKPNLVASLDRGSATLAKISALTALLWSSLIEECEERISEKFVELLASSILVVMLHDVPHSYSSYLNRSSSPAIPRHVKQAIQFMVENTSLPITVDDIAQASNVSKRTLHLGFARFLETSPLQYLRRIRLQGAHTDLSNGKGTVADIARRWGFTHAGYFTAYYRDAFGQAPSDTMRRAKESG